MAERKSVNKYYPPDWDPSKGSVNNYVGQHPLRDRAKKLKQGILVIRFEMPYNIWCGGCNAHIGMGVRYNAEKSKTGNYYSTPIYKFRMKCHLCDNYFEIQTDPKNHDYVILEGARRKEQRWDPKENEQIVPEDKATQKKLATDPMFKLEHGTDDKQRGKKAVSNLALLEVSKEGMKDDYILNKIARNKFREEKKSLKKIQEDDAALLKRSSLDIPLLKEKDEDVKLAGLMRLRAVDTYDEKQAQKRKEIVVRPIFQSKKRSREDDNEDVEQPQSKRLKIIRDNISKAKANSSTNPFDWIKINKIGSGITKNQLGIRLKNTKNSKLLTGINKCVDDHLSRNDPITNLDEAKDTLKVPLIGEGKNSNTNDSKYEMDKNATESEKIDGVICSVSDQVRIITNVLPDKSTKDACIIDDKKSDCLKHSKDMRGDLIHSRALDNCIDKNHEASRNKHLYQSGNTCSEPFKTVIENSCSSIDGNQPENSSDRNQHTEVICDTSTEGDSTVTEKSDKSVKNEESLCPEQMNTEVPSAIPGQRSLVAEYSDSEDTD